MTKRKPLMLVLLSVLIISVTTAFTKQPAPALAILTACPDSKDSPFHACPVSSTLQTDARGIDSLVFKSLGNWTATLMAEMSLDPRCQRDPAGVVWYPQPFLMLSHLGTYLVKVWTHGDRKDLSRATINLRGLECVRIRALSYTSGPVKFKITARTEPVLFDEQYQDKEDSNE